MTANTDPPPQFVFCGTVVRKTEKVVSVRLIPGLVLDLRTEDIDEIEEATDEITERAYVRVCLKPDAEISANFKPRLARLAAQAEGRPYVLGGAVEEGAPSYEEIVDEDLPLEEEIVDGDGVRSVLPAIDPEGLAAFAKSLPPESWDALSDAMAGDNARLVALAASSKKTKYRTKYKTRYITRATGKPDTRTDERTDTKDDPSGW